MDLYFRTAAADDAPRIVGWFASHGEAVLWGGPKVPADFDAAWLAQEMSDPLSLYRVAHTAEGAVVGVYGLRAFPDEGRQHIQRLAVAPGVRGKGLGRRLAADAVATALARGAGRISLNVYGSNLRALGIYERLGFRAAGQRTAPEDASGVSIYMEMERG